MPGYYLYRGVFETNRILTGHVEWPALSLSVCQFALVGSLPRFMFVSKHFVYLCLPVFWLLPFAFRSDGQLGRSNCFSPHCHVGFLFFLLHPASSSSSSSRRLLRINTTPSTQHHQHNTINTTPSTQHHQHNTINTTPTQHTINTTHHQHNTINTTS